MFLVYSSIINKVLIPSIFMVYLKLDILGSNVLRNISFVSPLTYDVRELKFFTCLLR